MIQNIILYILISFLLFFLSAKISYKFNLVDKPSKRKIHIKPTALTGGVALSIIFLSSLEFFDVMNSNYNMILTIGFLIALIGFIDDIYNLNAGGKLSLQVIPIFYLIVFEKMYLTQLGNYDYFILNLGTFSIPFTLICVLYLINSFNYFDGLDGLLSFTTISVIIILFFLSQNENIRLFLLTIIIPMFIFILFNFSILKLPKLFLGDSGSLLIGFIISFILIYLAISGLVHPILLAWSVSIFVYEFLSINLIRLKKNKKLFKAGQDHLHYLLLKKNNSILLSDFSISLSNIIMFLIGYIAFHYISPVVSLFLFLCIFVVYHNLRLKFL
tara:strand:+ start:195 stop:1181 length:987 start_codon:yes stop_codon:yes gene_type:complete